MRKFKRKVKQIESAIQRGDKDSALNTLKNLQNALESVGDEFFDLFEFDL